MKKRIAFVLCIVMMLSMVLAGCSKTYAVETDLTELKLQGEKKVKGGEDYEATLAPKGDYLLPEEITVKVDGSKLSAKKYTYDAETGEILIPGDEITGDIEIIAEGVELTLEGEWVGTVDLSQLFNEAMVSGDAELGSYCNFTGITFKLRMEFTEDICTMYVDADSVDEMAAAMKEQLPGFLYDYIEGMIASYGLDMSVEDMVSAMGYSSLDDFVEDIFDVDDLVSSFTDLYESGSYVAEDDLLYIADSANVDAKSVEPNPYVLDGDKLTIKATGNEDEAEAFLYPLVLERVK